MRFQAKPDRTDVPGSSTPRAPRSSAQSLERGPNPAQKPSTDTALGPTFCPSPCCALHFSLWMAQSAICSDAAAFSTCQHPCLRLLLWSASGCGHYAPLGILQNLQTILWLSSVPRVGIHYRPHTSPSLRPLLGRLRQSAAEATPVGHGVRPQ